MKSSLDKLPSMLGLKRVAKGFYAWRLANRESDLDYVGKIPPAYDFGIDRMSEEKLVDFWAWYDPLEADPNFIYDMRAEAIKYCE